MSVEILTSLPAEQLRNLCLVSARGKRYISSPKSPDRLWSPSNLLLSGYWGHFPRQQRSLGAQGWSHIPI